MENNQEKDFKDFEDDNSDVASEMKNELAFANPETEIKTLKTEEEIPSELPTIAPSPWDEFEQENSAVKKYLFYISKDFVPYIDNLSTDERSAYINDAIQKKIDFEAQEKKSNTKKRVMAHFVVMVLTFILSMPIVLLACHKAIMATFDNYKYSQENFEKLYKERFSKDKAYMRSIQYNKKQEAKKHK